MRRQTLTGPLYAMRLALSPEVLEGLRVAAARRGVTLPVLVADIIRGWLEASNDTAAAQAVAP